jgi:peptide chain release factor subunit 1
MITSQVLTELIRFEAPNQRIFSVVLGLHPERQIERDYRIVFRNLVRDLAARLDDSERKALEPEVERVATYLGKVEPQGLGVVIYSCSPAQYWRTCYLPESPRDEVHFTPRPRLRPLLDHVDEHERYAIVLADRDTARVLVVTQRDIEDWWQLQSVIQGRHKQGGWSQSNFQRSHDKAVDDHLKSVRDHLINLDEQLDFSRIFIGGPTEATARLRELLPPALRDQIAGTFAIEMFATDAQVLERTREVARQVERDGEMARVERVISDTGAGGRAVTGLDATLRAVCSGQVDEVVVSGTLSVPGAVCRACGRLAAGDVYSCPDCGGALSVVDDVIEDAILRVMSEGGSVEIVHGSAETRLLDETGGIGAILRYVPATAGIGG